MNNERSTDLVRALRNTSSLLEHYGYSGHYPTLSELQHLLGRAIANIEDAAIAAHARPSNLDSVGLLRSGGPMNGQP